MKKIFIALAVMAALMFSVAPSQALNSIDDNVPGVNPLLPFFLVNKAGYSNNTGLDTLFVIQEVGGGPTQFKTKGTLHLIVRDKLSYDKGSTVIPYTPNDVVALSVRDVIKACVGVVKLADLEITLNGVAYYTGYIDFYNLLNTSNNLVGFMYVIDLANGWAAASTMPVFEDASNTGYDAVQKWTTTDTYQGKTYTLEPFSPQGYALSALREMKDCTTTGSIATSFRLMPRWFLKDLNAETFIPIWTSSNHSTSATSWTYLATAYIYDNEENMLDLPIDIPYELNWIDVRDLLTGDWQAKTGGWIHIPLSNTVSRGTLPWDSSWLAYSYQTASSSSIGANWSVLHAVHREVGTEVGTL